MYNLRADMVWQYVLFELALRRINIPLELDNYTVGLLLLYM